MKKFKNIETGNVLTVKNEDTIALMEKSNRYIEVSTTGKKSGKQKDAKPDADADNAATE